MESSMATASLGSMSELEEADPEPLTFTMQPITPTTSEALTERISALLPDFGEKPIPFSALKPAGAAGTVYVFTVAKAKPGSFYGKDYSLETGDPDAVALLGLVVLYQGGGGYINAKVVVLATRTALLPAPEEGFVPDRFVTFGLPKLASFLRTRFPGRAVLVRVARKQKIGDAEYMGTVGTLATLGFAYSHYTAARSPERVKFKLYDEDAAVEYGQTEAAPEAGRPESVVYKYAAPGKLTYDKVFTFPMVEAVQVERPGKMDLAPTIEMVADALVVESFGDFPAGKDITIPDAVLRDVDPMEPRRGGRRKTYRKKGRKTTSRRSS
jgi:hypothetical protein